MRRALTDLSEVVAGGDQACSEVSLPDAVNDDAGGQRVPGSGNAVGQFQPAAPGCLEGGVASAVDNLQEASRSHRAGAFVTSAAMNR